MQNRFEGTTVTELSIVKGVIVISEVKSISLSLASLEGSITLLIKVVDATDVVVGLVVVVGVGGSVLL
jgi:hypothetical protein